MGQLGIKVLLNSLNSEEVIIKKYAGKVIKKASFGGNEIVLEFEDGTKIEITDDGQSCCEERYMTSSDDFSSLVGNQLFDIDVKEVTETSADYDTHEIAFLHIITNKATVVVETHNKHNGYYGGFSLTVKEVKSANTESTEPSTSTQ